MFFSYDTTSHTHTHGCGSKLQRQGYAGLIFGSIWQDAILAHLFEPQPHDPLKNGVHYGSKVHTQGPSFMGFGCAWKFRVVPLPIK